MYLYRPLDGVSHKAALVNSRDGTIMHSQAAPPANPSSKSARRVAVVKLERPIETATRRQDSR